MKQKQEKMELQVGVKVLLKNKDSKFLILKRSSEKYPDIKRLWDIPGGRINPGLSLFENLKREVLEETGLDITSYPKILYAQDIFSQDKAQHVVRITYVAETDGQPSLSDENVDFSWLTFNEMKKVQGLDLYLEEVLNKISITSVS